MTEREKLEAKMDKRLNMRAVTKDNMKIGRIVGHTINSENNTVKYLIYFDDKTTRLCDEANVVLMKDSN